MTTTTTTKTTTHPFVETADLPFFCGQCGMPEGVRIHDTTKTATTGGDAHLNLSEWIELCHSLDATPDITPRDLALKAKRVMESRRTLARQVIKNDADSHEEQETWISHDFNDHHRKGEPCFRCDSKQPSDPAELGQWQISGYVLSTRSDGERVVRITAPHPEGGGQDVAEILESVAPKAITAFNIHATLVAALEQAQNYLSEVIANAHTDYAVVDITDAEPVLDTVTDALKQARGGE